MTDSTNVADGETQARLEAERDFLLASLDDLESEHAAGNVDDSSYRRLHDDYTARAATVLRQLQGEAPGHAKGATPSRGAPRRWVVVAGVAGFVLLTGVVLAYALGARLPGQTGSGNTTATTKARSDDSSRRRQLEAAVAQNPNDLASRLLLAIELERDDDVTGALRQYDAVLQIAPTNAEALAQSGRLLYVAAQNASAADAPGLVDQAEARLDRAVQADPDHAEARFFRAVLLANERGDFVGAQNDAQRYLVAAPNGRFVDQARQLLADVTKALEAPTTTTTK